MTVDVNTMTGSDKQALPVADFPEVRRYARGVGLARRRELIMTLVLYGLAAVSGLFGPRLLGDLVNSVQSGTTKGHVDVVVLAIAGFLVLQTVLTRYAQLAAGKFGEAVLAELATSSAGSWTCRCRRLGRAAATCSTAPRATSTI